MHPSSYRDVITAGTAPLVEAILAREAEPEAHVKRALTNVGAEESCAQASRRFAEHSGFPVGRTTVLRVVEAHARRAEGYLAHRLPSARAAFAQPLVTRPGVDRMLVVELDGGAGPAPASSPPPAPLSDGRPRPAAPAPPGGLA